jgi:hypothetical protein
MSEKTETYKLVSLHKHWLTADAVQYHLRQSIKSTGAAQLTPPNFDELARRLPEFSVLTVWYSLLYVVVEGYRELECQDTTLDQLITQSYHVKNLRRFRNATFHFQEEPIPQKVTEFLYAADSDVWINNLNRALKAFFERELNISEIARAMIVS